MMSWLGCDLRWAGGLAGAGRRIASDHEGVMGGGTASGQNGSASLRA